MDIECSQTYDYEIENDFPSRGRKPYVYDNDLKYLNYNNININNVKDLPTNFKQSTIISRVNDCCNDNNTTLDLSHLELDTINFETLSKHIYKIKYLFLSNNLLKTIDLSLFNNLIVIDLSNNKLKNIPTLPKMIEELVIHDNQIENEELYKYECLKRLNISSNKLTKINPIKSLELLICDDNSIKCIQSFPKLKKLTCERNCITDIIDCPNLEILECNDNKLVSLSNLTKLIELYCNNNKIISLSNFPMINILYCIKNCMTVIEYYPALIELACDYNTSVMISKKYNDRIEDTHIYDKYAVLILK
jgi:hypothetical protein